MSTRAKLFETVMQDRQVAWRLKPGNVQCSDWGCQNKKLYEHILPRKQWEQGLWPGIRTGQGCALTAYLGTEIQPHTGKHNLKSSWVLCANLYFPFGQTPEGRALLAGFLREYVCGDVNSVDKLHLEHQEDDDLRPSVLLGEGGGKRGSGQTSPDFALHVNGRTGLFLIENKFVEHSFYRCSARRTKDTDDRPGNPNPERCKRIATVLDDPASQCHQCAWKRRYWDILRPVVNKSAMCSLNSCPAAYAGYQLFRQQALAEGIAQSGKYAFVYSCVALDARNDVLKSCLKSTGLANWETEWGNLFAGKARFKVFTHQDWVVWVAGHGDRAHWGGWLEYVKERYGYGA